jgi:hypothetical protein
LLKASFRRLSGTLTHRWYRFSGGVRRTEKSVSEISPGYTKATPQGCVDVLNLLDCVIRNLISAGVLGTRLLWGHLDDSLFAVYTMRIKMTSEIVRM